MRIKIVGHLGALIAQVSLIPGMELVNVGGVEKMDIAADRDGSTVDVEGEDFNNVVHYQYDAIFTGIELSGQYNFAQYQNCAKYKLC